MSILGQFLPRPLAERALLYPTRLPRRRSLSGQLRARSGLMHCNIIAETEPDFQHLYPSHPVPLRR
jgi:hypothetical protein